MIKQNEILEQLNACAAEFTFPMLDNGYVYPAGTRLTAYRNETDWALVIEVIGFNYRAEGHDGINNCLHVFGNCLAYEPGTRNENFLQPTDDAPECNTFDPEESFYLNPDCTHFLLKDKLLPVIHDPSIYISHGITPEEERINAFEWLRLLDMQHHDQLIATPEELAERIPVLPKVLELTDWYHPDLANGDLPGENETFQLVAQVLESGDATLYQPTQAPNTHWSHWPDGGTL